MTAKLSEKPTVQTPFGKRSSTSLEMQCSMTMSASAATAIMKQLLQYLLQRGTGAKTVQLTGPLNHDKK